ncbi:hypothetical protein [Sphingopyxis sp.]|uniref:hypothetical protein n=1 Tax=Sphingopyxis sp. TaxID=1908224 RepID=UPI003D6D2A86
MDNHSANSARRPLACIENVASNWFSDGCKNFGAPQRDMSGENRGHEDAHSKQVRTNEND